VTCFVSFWIDFHSFSALTVCFQCCFQRWNVKSFKETCLHDVVRAVAVLSSKSDYGAAAETGLVEQKSKENLAQAMVKLDREISKVSMQVVSEPQQAFVRLSRVVSAYFSPPDVLSWASKRYFFQGGVNSGLFHRYPKRYFQGGKVVKYHFTHSKLRKQPFCWNWTENFQPPSDAHACSCNES